MDIYLVGGAVRDRLLGLPIRERDWVVVGATPDQLLRQGYKSVGKDFPVFLHPKTQEEYALARTERKTAPGYHGFSVHADPSVTLAEDLRRRDLTINALAQDADGAIIDPYGGQQDLADRWLRHVSDAFAEDPVRLLRLARFQARFAPLGFRVAPETQALLRGMVAAGEVDALVPERVFAELVKALATPQPAAFFQVLADCGALSRVFPGLHWDETRAAALQQAVALTLPVADADAAHDPSRPGPIRWAALLGDHPPAAVESLCGHLKTPTEWRDLSRLVARVSLPARSAIEALEQLEQLDALRRPARFADWAVAVAANGVPIDAVTRLQQAQQVAQAVAVQPLLDQGHRGADLAHALRAARLAAIEPLFTPQGSDD